MSSSTSSSEPARWGRFLRRLLAVGAGGVALVYAFIVTVDPWDLLPLSWPAERPPISTNARFAFAGLARAERFDSAILGTSTSRLLRPEVLNPAFQARFANLAMNAATAYEQARLFQVFARAHPLPKAVVLGLDAEWCGTGPVQRYTPRPFPEWAYERNTWGAYRHMFSLYAVQEAGKQFAVLTRLMRPRYGWDGYTTFLPDERFYDLARARTHLGPVPTRVQEDAPPPANLSFPALELLAGMLAAAPPETRVLAVFMPYHASLQPAPGSAAAAVLKECKRRVARMVAARRNGVVLDYMIRSAITLEDSNYWDQHHYRVAIADRIMATLAAAAHAAPPPAEDYAILAP